MGTGPPPAPVLATRQTCDRFRNGGTARPERFTMLTTTDVRALRHADAICWDHLADGTGQIRAILRADNSPTGFEQVHTIKVEMSRVENYAGLDGTRSGDGPWTAFHMTMHVKYDDVAQTILRSLRKDAKVAFHWTRNNNSPVLERAGLVCDEFRIKVQNGNRADTFNVTRSVSLDNTARMIRKAA